MAKKISYNEIRNINEDWGYDDRNGNPYSGRSVQDFIKKTLNEKGEALTLNDMSVSGEYATYGGIIQYIGEKPTYETLKRDMVKRRYSNDDQIAIMLNGDADSLAKMQAWREWSSQVAHKIIETLNA